MQTHDLNETLRTLLLDERARSLLQSLYEDSHKCTVHCAQYYITDEGDMVAQKRGSRQKTLRAFGGCNWRSSVVRMINSLRLEAMDEGSIILSHDNFISASPLYLLPLQDGGGAVLLQVVKIKSEWLRRTTLWCPEAARSKHPGLPVHAGVAAAVQAGVVQDFASPIQVFPMDTALQKSWRHADLLSLQALQPVLAATLAAVDVATLVDSGVCATA